MSIIAWEKDQTIAIIRMNNGENRQNLDFAKSMIQTLDEVIADKETTAVILTSTDSKYWSLGVDIDWLGKQLQNQDFQNIKDFMYGMDEVFKKLLLLPVPAIAAINGHAFGNGAILSCACDFRFMRSDKGFFCFPEVDLGIPFLPGMTAFVKKSIPYHKFNELKLTGRKAAAAELEIHHVIQKASASETDLINDALAFAGTFQKKRGIFAELKKRMHKEIIRIIDQEDPEYIESLFLMVQE
ncbi:MAG: enoyl-CoA hydratase/isomerase family protein [Desulfobacterales bacterium]|jgi:enoyl-CoA hydratase/carnithine racemase|nr:enoyl-CoA hydratase/isomerase family protein [Desulfobacterales bacterium]